MKEEKPIQEDSDLVTVIFANIGLPQIVGTRIVRAEILHEIVAALLREGLLTKDQLSSALERGEKEAEKAAAKWPRRTQSEIDTANGIIESALGASRHWRELLIDDKPQTEPQTEPQ